MAQSRQLSTNNLYQTITRIKKAGASTRSPPMASLKFSAASLFRLVLFLVLVDTRTHPDHKRGTALKGIRILLRFLHTR